MIFRFGKVAVFGCVFFYLRRASVQLVLEKLSSYEVQITLTDTSWHFCSKNYNMQLRSLKYDFLLARSVLACCLAPLLVFLGFFFFCWSRGLETHAGRRFHVLDIINFSDTCTLVMVCVMMVLRLVI